MDADVAEKLWKDPDWTCPNCQFVNFAIRQKCRNCGYDSNCGEFPWYNPLPPYDGLPEGRGSAVSYLHVSPWWIWRLMFRHSYRDARVGIFRNLPGVVPGRWGFFMLGFEFGSRNPGDKIGVWLINKGLWRW